MDTDSIRVLYDNLTISKKIVNNMIKILILMMDEIF